MTGITDYDKCTGCGTCSQICPKTCITMKRNEEGFLYPIVDHENCINCKKCVKYCPENREKTDGSETIKGYMAYNLTLGERLRGSSGGIFELIASYVLNHGGVVFGAVMAKNCKSVYHTVAHTEKELRKMCGSKYVQSDIKETFKLAKEYLDNGKKVLYSGTPCQISGLLAFLGRTYENLYTQDIICHGVPSPMVWEKYVEYREKVASARAQRIFFRHKKYGWKRFSLLISFENNREYLSPLDKDLFMQGYLSNIFLRKSCYQCTHKTEHTESDISLADMWGIENIDPNANDNQGCSLIIVQSSKGEKLIEDIKESLWIKEIDLKEALKYNSARLRSVDLNMNRQLFMQDLSQYPIERVLKKYGKKKEKLKVKLYRVLRTIKIK